MIVVTVIVPYSPLWTAIMAGLVVIGVALILRWLLSFVPLIGR